MAIKTLLRISDGSTTVSDFCREFNCSVSNLLNFNSNNFRANNRLECAEYDEYVDIINRGETPPTINSYSPLAQLFINKVVSPNTAVKDYLSLCNRNNKVIVQGLVIITPYINNGDVRETGKYYMTNVGIPKLLTNTYEEELQNANDIVTRAGFRSAKAGYGNAKTITCNSYFQRVSPRQGEQDVAYLPVLPTEFSDNNSVTWNPVSLMGRSVDYQIYNGSSRDVSFTLNLHQELYNDSVSSGIKNIYNLVKLIESSCYPYYDEAWAGPPQVIFKIGNHLYIKGVLTSCSVNWKLPIDLDENSPTYGLYTNCDISVSVRETNGPYGAKDISSMEYGSYRNQIVKAKEINDAELTGDPIDVSALNSPEFGGGSGGGHYAQ